MGNFKAIMCSGKSMNKLDRYLKVGKPIMMGPTMDYHKTLWTLALANNSLKEKQSVRYISLYQTKEEALSIWDEHNWGFGCNVIDDNYFIDNISTIDEIIDIANKDKPVVLIIDYLDNRSYKNVSDLEDILNRLREVSEKNNTAVVVISAALKPTDEEMTDENIKEKYRHVIDNNFEHVLTVRDSNMVEIKEIGI